MERGRHQATMERLALTDAESTSVKEEAESARGALSLAIKNFKDSQEFKDKIFVDGFASYCIGYKDGRDIVEKLYPNLDLSNIVPLSSEEDIAEEITTPTEGDALAAPKPAPTTRPTPTTEVVVEQGEEEADW